MSATAPTILAISSSVAVGHVGLSAIVPTLHLLGRTVAAIPTILLSNHPGFAHVNGTRTNPETLHAMLDALEKNGWLSGIETVLTGYLPSPEHVAFAGTAVNRARQHNPNLVYVCDPVLGDHPEGLYIDTTAAEAIRDHLIPLADVILPNQFELGWLTGAPVTSPAEAISAAKAMGRPRVVAKSIPASANEICNIDLYVPTLSMVTVEQLQNVPKGTGDMFSALIAAGWPLPRASAALQATLNASRQSEHLAIIPAANQWRDATPLPASFMEAATE